MVNSLLSRVKTFRKASYFKNELYHSVRTYAFAGTGIHSLQNLYPVLRHFGVRLKYICTRTSSPSPVLLNMFPGCVHTNNIADILNDREVEGVFISASESAHFDLLKALLTGGKKVFVEKPPCQTSAELRELIDISRDGICKVGLQRRYWPAVPTLRRRIQTAGTYVYRFHTGKYTDSDLLTGLFIHPIDFAVYLFGEASVQSSFTKHSGNGTTVHIHLLHSGGVSGLLECSTEYSWNSPLESLTVNTSKEQLAVHYPTLVEGELKPGRILNIPAERIFNQAVITKRYFSAVQMMLPVKELNTIYVQGFYGEIKAFVDLVENRSRREPKNDLPSLIPVYEIFDAIHR